MPDRTNPFPAYGQFGPGIYAEWRASSLGDITEALEHRLALRLAGPLDNASVLDVGCGDGTWLLTCLEAGASRVAGCDPDPHMVAQARRQAIHRKADIALVAARAQALPFADNSFDVISCITVLTFVPNSNRSVQEMARVLRPGGRLVIGDLGRWNLWAARRRIRAWLGAKTWQAARFRTARELTVLTEQAGLVPRSVHGAIFYPPWTAAARRMAWLDPYLGAVTTCAAAFLAVRATKPVLGLRL